jgi:hypothetical protein
MSAKTATVKLYVAFASLLTLIISLVCAIVRLILACITWTTHKIERQPSSEAKRPVPITIVTHAATPVPPSQPTANVAAHQQVEFALVNMGYKKELVSRIVAKLAVSDVGTMVREGLRSLSS